LPSEKEFKVNDYITLKLEDENTNIYVKGELFNQCRYLILNIQVDKISSFDEIESIDEASEKLDVSLERGLHKIDPETNFWGQCSKLQVWVENKYNTRLLHRNLAFPLLKKLSDVGDPNARRIFKEEICKRFESGNSVVIQYLLEENYLTFMNNEEKIPIVTDILNTTDKIDDNYNKRNTFSDLINAIKGTELMNTKYSLIEIQFTDILNTIGKIDDNYIKRIAFSDFISQIKGTKLMNTKYSLIEIQFTDILNKLDKINDDEYKRKELSKLISKIKGTKLLKEKLIDILNTIDNNYDKRYVFSDLLSAIKGTKSLEEKFTDILNTIDKIDDDRYKIDFLSDLISAIKGTEVFENNFSAIEEIVQIILKKENLDIISKFVKNFEGTSILVDIFFKISDFLINCKPKTNYYVYKNVYEYLDHIGSSKIRTGHQLIDAIKYTELSIRDYSSIKIMVQNLLRKSIEDHSNFEMLIYLLKESGLTRDFIIDILNFIKNIEDKYLSLICLSKAIPIIKNTNILKENYVIIDDMLQSFIFLIDEIEKNDSFEEFKKIIFFMKFLYIINGIGQFNKHFMIIGTLISNIFKTIDSLGLRNSDLTCMDLYENNVIGGLVVFFFMPCLVLDDRLLYMIPKKGKVNLKSKIIELINKGNIPLNILKRNIKFFKKGELEELFSKNEKIIIESLKNENEIFEDYLSEQELSNVFTRNISKELVRKLSDGISNYIDAMLWEDRIGIEWIISSFMCYLSDENILDLFLPNLSLLDYMNYDEYYLGVDDNVVVDKLNATKVPDYFSLLLVRCLNEKDEIIRNKALKFINELGERAEYAIHFHRNMEYKDQIIKAISIIHKIPEDFLKEFILNIVRHPKDCMNNFIGHYEKGTEFERILGGKLIEYRQYWEVIKKIQNDLTAKINYTFDSNITFQDFLMKFPKINEIILYLSNNVLPINFKEISNKEELIEIIDKLLESEEFKKIKFPCYERYNCVSGVQYKDDYHKVEVKEPKHQKF
jgi:hypothetical protein